MEVGGEFPDSILLDDGSGKQIKQKVEYEWRPKEDKHKEDVVIGDKLAVIEKVDKTHEELDSKKSESVKGKAIQQTPTMVKKPLVIITTEREQVSGTPASSGCGCSGVIGENSRRRIITPCDRGK